MATLGAGVSTLSDWAKRIDPNGKVAKVVEILGKSNAILDDVLWKAGNLPTGHRATIRTGLPTVYWRSINKGVPSSKSRTAQVDEHCGLLEGRSQLDVEEAKLNGNTTEYRMSEAVPFVESMNQEYKSTLIYGNAGTSPEEFTGFAPRYSSLSADNAQNIVVGGGSGVDNTSVWLVGWGDNTVHCLFPNSQPLGLEHEDLGIGDAFDGDNNRFRAYMDRWVWKPGLCVKDWRYVVRIPNIDVSALIAKSSAADLVELMIKATHRIPNLGACRPVFYMNRTCFQMLDIQRRDDVISGGSLRYDVVDGKRVPFFREIPVRSVDEILENEALVS